MPPLTPDTFVGRHPWGFASSVDFGPPACRSQRCVCFDVFEVDLQACELRKRGLRVELRDQSFQILSLLLDCPGQVVSRLALQTKLWPEDTLVDVDGGLNKAISHLREVLGDAAEDPRFIEALPKRGYRFLARVEKLGSFAVSGERQ